MSKTLDDYIIPGKEFLYVPIEKIVSNDNYRKHYTLKSLDTLGQSIANRGQLQPGLAELKEGLCYVVSGNRRYWSIRRALDKGWMTSPFMALTLTNPLPQSLRLKIQIAENDNKEAHPAYRVANALWQRYVRSLEKITDLDLTNISCYEEIPGELKQQLPIGLYAESVGKDRKTIWTAFKYQRLNGEIKQRIVRGDLSYDASTPLALVGDKNVQRTLLSIAFKEAMDEYKTKYDLEKKLAETKNKKYPRRRKVGVTRERVQKVVQGYLKSLEELDADKFFNGYCDVSKSRSKSLTELSFNLDKAESYLRIMTSLGEFDSYIWDLGGEYHGRNENPLEIITRAYAPLEKYHLENMQNPIYARRWSHKNGTQTLEDFVNGHNGLRKTEELMRHAKFKSIPVSKIISNPYNPRGNSDEFNTESLKRLSDSISDVGLIQEVAVMKGSDGKYILLEGHRREKAIKMAGLKQVRAIVFPPMSVEEQELVMLDTDLFEEVDKNERANGIAKQFYLEKEANPDLTKENFIEKNPHLSTRIVNDAITYHNLPERIKVLYQENLITYQVAITLANVQDSDTQLRLAETAAIMQQSNQQIAKIISESEQNTLFSKECLESMVRESQVNHFLTNLHDSFLSITKRVELMSEKAKLEFVQDYYLSHKFQKFFQNLESVVQNLNSP